MSRLFVAAIRRCCGLLLSLTTKGSDQLRWPGTGQAHWEPGHLLLFMIPPWDTVLFPGVVDYHLERGQHLAVS